MLHVLGHHAVERDTDTFDDGEQYRARDGAVAHGFVTASYGEGSTGEETSDDGVPRVFLLPYALDCTVVCVE